MNSFVRRGFYILATFLLLAASQFQGQVPQRSKDAGTASDPGPRAGAAAAGGPIAGLTGAELAVFNDGLQTFNEIDDVRGTVTGSKGLGPSFNLDSCAMCHAQPAAGGTSPAQNPQLQDLAEDVEALLVHRIRDARDHFRVSIDACYRLVGLLRLHWTGMSGGDRVWSEIGAFFAALERREDGHA